MADLFWFFTVHVDSLTLFFCVLLKCKLNAANNQFADKFNNGGGLLSSVLLFQMIFTFKRWLRGWGLFPSPTGLVFIIMDTYNVGKLTLWKSSVAIFERKNFCRLISSQKLYDWYIYSIVIPVVVEAGLTLQAWIYHWWLEVGGKWKKKVFLLLKKFH